MDDKNAQASASGYNLRCLPRKIYSDKINTKYQAISRFPQDRTESRLPHPEVIQEDQPENIQQETEENTLLPNLLFNLGSDTTSEGEEQLLPLEDLTDNNQDLVLLEEDLEDVQSLDEDIHQEVEPIFQDLPEVLNQVVNQHNIQHNLPVVNNQAMNQQGAFGPMVAAFAPSSFNGLHPENANKFWDNFVRYADLAGVRNENRCHLLGLLMSGPSELWFNNLPNATKRDFEQLEVAFRERYINADNAALQRQMTTLTRQQRPTETVDEYFLDLRSKMQALNYDEALQMSLLINGLKPEIKHIILQHLPFQNIDALFNKAKLIESVNPDVQALTQSLLPNAVQINAMSLKGRNDHCSDDLLEEIKKLHSKIDRIENSRNIPGNNQRFQPRGRYQPQRKQNDGLRCYYCNGTNHLQRNCFLRQQDEKNRPRQPGRSLSPGPRRNNQFNRSRNSSPSGFRSGSTRNWEN